MDAGRVLAGVPGGGTPGLSSERAPSVHTAGRMDAVEQGEGQRLAGDRLACPVKDSEGKG